MKRYISITIMLVALATPVYIFAVWKLHSDAPVVSATNPDWKVYENKKYGFSVEYPPDFIRGERVYEKDNALSVWFDDPSNKFSRYGYISVWGRQSDIDNASEYFTGPYPKEIPPSGNNSSRTVVERTLFGVRGIEYYGYGGEGTSYDDVFMYKNKHHLWAVYLDPVIEGRIAAYREFGTPPPTEAYKDMYKRILAGIKISS